MNWVNSDSYLPNLAGWLGVIGIEAKELGFAHDAEPWTASLGHYENEEKWIDKIRNEVSEKGHNVKTVFIQCSLETLKTRDTKGLYRRALLEDGHPEKVYNFTGISDPFETPENPDSVIKTDSLSIKEAGDILEKYIIQSVV